MKKLFFALVCIGTLLTSCGDDNGPQLEITGPANGSSYMAGDVVTLTGTATDDVGVTSITITGTDELSLNGSIPLDNVTDRTNIPFSVEITLDAAVPAGDYTLTVSASDGDGNVDDETLDITVQ